MRVGFLTQNLRLSGGVGVVVEHVRLLRLEHGVDAQLILTRRECRERWAYPGLDELPVLSLAEAADVKWDVAVATWWETTVALVDLEAARTAYFVQSLEDRFYPPDDPRRMLAAVTHSLPLAMITEARWIADVLDQLRPGTATLVVPNGVDKAVFAIPSAVPDRPAGAPLRILVEGDPAVPFKGVPEALSAVAAMRERHHVTLVSAGSDAAPGLRADEIVGPLLPAQMAELMSSSDVLLKLSRVEGMAAPPLEAFHRGATCVVTPVTGHEEYVVHGENGLVVGFDDPYGTTRALDLLARDRALLRRLREGALETAARWPSTARSADLLRLALEQVRELPDTDPTRSAGRIMADSRAGYEAVRQFRRDHARLATRMARVEALYDRVIGRIPVPALRRAADRARGR